VLAIGRTHTGVKNDKLRETTLDAIGDVTDFDACFFCLGISSAGMNEAEYRKITYDITLDAANVLVKNNPKMTFIYVSGSGTDSTAKGRSMWARVKGETENALLALPFKAAYMFRPAAIRPMHGIRSKTALYRAFYVIATPLWMPLRAIAPKFVTTTEAVGRAMLIVAKKGADKKVLENHDINAIAS
jgi:uncharacterized protein YbjT (DUF2867 family)